MSFIWLKEFVESFAYDLRKDKQQRYKNHIGYIKLLIILAVSLFVLDKCISHPQNFKAHYVEVNAHGVPIGEEDLTEDKAPKQIIDFTEKVARLTFNLDSYGHYKQYRSQLNFVNSRYYRLSWEYLNITQAEYESGYVDDGQERYYLRGQELAAVIIKSGIYKMLREQERKFWLEVDSSEIVDSSICDPEECFFPARYWTVKVSGKLLMTNLDTRTRQSRFVPITLKFRVISVNKIQSPGESLMIERLSAVLGRGTK